MAKFNITRLALYLLAMCSQSSMQAFTAEDLLHESWQALSANNFDKVKEISAEATRRLTARGCVEIPEFGWVHEDRFNKAVLQGIVVWNGESYVIAARSKYTMFSIQDWLSNENGKLKTVEQAINEKKTDIDRAIDFVTVK